MKPDSQVSSRKANQKSEAMIGWNPAPYDCVTLNTDGSVLGNPNRAAAGGIFRDHLGRPIATFSTNLGVFSIMRAELRATEIGFRIAWDMGLRKVQLQMDSLAAAAAINGETDVNLRHKRTLHNIRELRQRNWETSISHILEKAMLPISLPTMGILLSLVSVLIVITPLRSVPPFGTIPVGLFFPI
ncbi:Putative ribonuclease H protein At1g65750 [Linum perenne]